MRRRRLVVSDVDADGKQPVKDKRSGGDQARGACPQQDPFRSRGVSTGVDTVAVVVSSASFKGEVLGLASLQLSRKFPTPLGQGRMPVGEFGAALPQTRAPGGGRLDHRSLYGIIGVRLARGAACLRLAAQSGLPLKGILESRGDFPEFCVDPLPVCVDLCQLE
jgi:hypothetical protein